MSLERVGAVEHGTVGQAEAAQTALWLGLIEPSDGAPSHLTLTVWTRDYRGFAVAHDALAGALAGALMDSATSFEDWLLFMQRRAAVAPQGQARVEAEAGR